MNLIVELLKNLIAAEMLKGFPAFIESKGSLALIILSRVCGDYIRRVLD
jgi:hypothetical protein